MGTIPASWNTGSGKWFNGGNWNEPNPAPPPNQLHYVPGANNDVVIGDNSGVGTPFTIDYDGTSTINTISATGVSTIDVTKGSLTVAAGNNVVGFVNLASGTSLGVTAGTLSLNGGSFAGTVAGNGTLRLINGTLNLNAGVALTVAEVLLTYQVGSATVSTTNLNTDLTYSKAFLLQQVFGNDPILNLNGHTLTLSGSSTLDGTINGPGTVAITGTAALSGNVEGGAGVSVENTAFQVGGIDLDGTLFVDTGASYEILKASNIANGGKASTENHGTFTVSGAGSSAVDGSFTSDGTLGIGKDATLNLAAGKQTIAGSVSGAGTLAFGFAHDATITSTDITVAAISIAGGNGGGTLTLADDLGYGGSFTFSNPFGTLDLGTHTLTLGGSSISLDAGNIVGPGTLKITGTATVGSVSIGYNGSAATLENAGTATQNGSLSLDGTLLNDAGKTYTLNANTNANIVDNGATVTNNGTFSVTGGGFSTVGGIFNNAGTLSIGTGATLTLAGNTETLAGAITGGGTLALGFAHNATIATTNVTVATISINGGNGGGTVTLGNDLSYAGSFGLTDPFGALALNSHTLTLSGTSYFAGGDIQGDGTVKVTGSSTIGGIRIGYNGSPATFENAGTITQNGTLRLNGALLNDAGKSYTLTAGYIVTGSQGVVQNSGTLSIVGTGTSSIDGTFTNKAGGTLEVGSGAQLRLFGTQTLGGTVTGAGALALGGTSTVNTAISTASLEIAGFTTLGVDLTYAGAFTFDAFDRINLNGHTLTLAGTSTLTAGYNDIEGPGTLKITGTATLGGFSVGNLGAGATVENAGSVGQVGSLSVTGTLLNDAGHVWTLTSAGNIGGSGGASFVNKGSFVDDSAGTSTIGIAFGNEGSVVANQGSLVFNNGFTNIGLVGGGAGTLTFTGGFTNTGVVRGMIATSGSTTTVTADAPGQSHFTGGSGDNVIVVMSAPTFVDGGAGTDTLEIAASMKLAAGSLAGIERIQVDDGVTADLSNLGGGQSVTLASKAGGTSTVIGTGFADGFKGGAGNDRYYVNDALDSVKEAAGGGSDAVYTSVNYTLGAGQEIEFLVANAGSKALTLTGNAFANSLISGGGKDMLVGGAGNDIYNVNTAGDQVIEQVGGGADSVFSSVDYILGAGQEIEQLFANAGATGLTLTGNELANRVVGGAGADHLYGGGGKDVLEGRGGADIMEGGAGDDLYYLDSSSDQVVEAVGGGLDNVYTSTDFKLATGQEVEFLRANAGATGLTLTGNERNDGLISGAGLDTLIGGIGNDTYNVNDAGDHVVEQVGQGIDTVFTSVSYTLETGQEIEYLRANSGSVGLTLTGNAFNNTFYASYGIDTLIGGAGNDTYWVNNTNDVVKEAVGGGSDNIYTSASYTLGAGQEVEFLRANAGTTGLTLAGNERDNALISGLGDDTLIGGAGNDTYNVNGAGDQIVEQVGGGSDTVYASASYALGAGQEIEFLRANAGTTGLTLTGNGLANTVIGGSGADTISGGGGADVLRGSAGADSFVFKALSDSVVGAGRAVISDFAAGSDRIDLSAIQAVSGAGTDQAFGFIGTAAFTKHAGELHQLASGGSIIVEGDVNGDGVADFQIALTGAVTLQTSDFVL